MHILEHRDVIATDENAITAIIEKLKKSYNQKKRKNHAVGLYGSYQHRYDLCDDYNKLRINIDEDLPWGGINQEIPYLMNRFTGVNFIENVKKLALKALLNSADQNGTVALISGDVYSAAVAACLVVNSRDLGIHTLKVRCFDGRVETSKNCQSQRGLDQCGIKDEECQQCPHYEDVEIPLW
jgi:hypothetical protein